MIIGIMGDNRIMILRFSLDKCKMHTFQRPSINTLTDKAVYRWHETFISDVRLPAMSLGLRFCASRKGGTVGGGWVSALSLGSMAASGLGLEKLLVGAGWAISPTLHKWPRKQSSRLVGPPFLTVKRFSW